MLQTSNYFSSGGHGMIEDTMHRAAPWDFTCQWTSDLIPRYLFRVQLPTSIDTVNVDRIGAHYEERVLCSNLDGGLHALLRNGDPTRSNLVAWTSSLLYALAHAQKVTAEFRVGEGEEEEGGGTYAPLREDEVEIFVLDTSSFAPGTFRAAWVINEGSLHRYRTDYVVEGSLDIRGKCARVTLQDLNEAGLRDIVRPYKYTSVKPHEIARHCVGYVQHAFPEERLQTFKVAERLFKRQYAIRYPEDKTLDAAGGMAKLFPAELEIPMFLSFLSLCLPPEMQKIQEKLQYEFGTENILGSLSGLQLDRTAKNSREHEILQHLTQHIMQSKQEKDMQDLTDFLRDTPFNGGNDNSNWM